MVYQDIQVSGAMHVWLQKYRDQCAGRAASTKVSPSPTCKQMRVGLLTLICIHIRVRRLAIIGVIGGYGQISRRHALTPPLTNEG